MTTSSQDEAPSLKKKKKPETEKPINLDKDVDEIRNAPNDASTTILPSQESERSNMSSWSLPIRDDVAVTNEKVAVDRSYTQLMSGTSTSITRVGGMSLNIRHVRCNMSVMIYKNILICLGDQMKQNLLYIIFHKS